jgi:lipoprotein-anchoring transpeptidase ErfK/SrfK
VSWRRLLAVAFAIALLGAGGTAATARAQDPATAPATPTTDPTAPADGSDPGAADQDTTDDEATEEIPPGAAAKPTQKSGGWVAKIIHPTQARKKLGSAAHAATLGTVFPGTSSPQELLVLAAKTGPDQRTWLQVRLPDRPNTATAWVAEDDVRLRHDAWWVRVRTSKRMVQIYENGKLRYSTKAVVGAPATPTPHGLFAVMFAALQADPHAFLGPWALHLTAHSNVLENYGGGPGRVAIHGRDGTSFLDPLGSARSHGCVRIPNSEIVRMQRDLTVGTPVEITS